MDQFITIAKSISKFISLEFEFSGQFQRDKSENELQRREDHQEETQTKEGRFFMITKAKEDASFFSKEAVNIEQDKDLSEGNDHLFLSVRFLPMTDFMA